MSLRTREHNKVQQVAKRPEQGLTSWRTIEMFSHTTFLYQKLLHDHNQTSLNLTKQDKARLNTSKQGGQTHSTKFSEV